MAYEGVDQEILQDFIVEAGEYIENLSEQLVDLEKTPEDSELLNSIFRAYHTIKGGAGFLNLTNLVEICHACESVFDALRHGNQHVSPELMDTILKAYDIINSMYASVQNQEPFDPAPKEIIDRLHALAQGGGALRQLLPRSPLPRRSRLRSPHRSLPLHRRQTRAATLTPSPRTSSRSSLTSCTARAWPPAPTMTRRASRTPLTATSTK